jgi:hypothetical protein
VRWVAPAVRLASSTRRFVCRPLFDEGLRVILFLLDENAGHRLASSAVVVDETTGGTSDFPCANRNRSGSGVCCDSVATFDGKAGATFLAHEPEVPAGISHSRSRLAMPRVGRSAQCGRLTIA